MNSKPSAINRPIPPASLPASGISPSAWPQGLCLLLAGLALSAATRAQSLYEYAYGDFNHNGAYVSGYTPVSVWDPAVGWVTRDRPELRWSGQAVMLGGSRQDVAGLARYSFNYANPVGGGISAVLDVPGGAMHSSITAPPPLRVWDPSIGNYRDESGYGYMKVGFQDKITIQGPALAAYQYIPISLIAHLDGSMTAGSGGGADYNFARVDFYAALFAAPDSSLGGAGEMRFQEAVYSGATANYDRTFVLHGEVGPQKPGGLISMWLNTSLGSTVGNGGTADFLNTARYELVLPEGYTYTSTMDFASEVPEATDAASIAGFGLLGIGVWRWKHGRRSALR